MLCRPARGKQLSVISRATSYIKFYALLFQAGYAVIFLNRKHSIQPFTKGLPSGEIMECLTEALEASQARQPDGKAIVQQAVTRATNTHSKGTLLRISFETLFQYLKVGCCLTWRACRGICSGHKA